MKREVNRLTPRRRRSEKRVLFHGLEIEPSQESRNARTPGPTTRPISHTRPELSQLLPLPPMLFRIPRPASISETKSSNCCVVRVVKDGWRSLVLGILRTIVSYEASVVQRLG
ncbi:hypothetical protein SLE2022_195980 [Rubroshorea leprosula]